MLSILVLCTGLAVWAQNLLVFALLSAAAHCSGTPADVVLGLSLPFIAAGAVLSGLLSDHIGRRTSARFVFVTSCTTAMAAATAFQSNANIALVLFCAASCAIGGGHIVAELAFEVWPPTWRPLATLVFPLAFFPVGFFHSGFTQQAGWSASMITCLVLTAYAGASLVFVPETAAFSALLHSPPRALLSLRFDVHAILPTRGLPRVGTRRENPQLRTLAPDTMRQTENATVSLAPRPLEPHMQPQSPMSPAAPCVLEDATLVEEERLVDRELLVPRAGRLATELRTPRGRLALPRISSASWCTRFRWLATLTFFAWVALSVALGLTSVTFFAPNHSSIATGSACGVSPHNAEAPDPVMHRADPPDELCGPRGAPDSGALSSGVHVGAAEVLAILIVAIVAMAFPLARRFVLIGSFVAATITTGVGAFAMPSQPCDASDGRAVLEAFLRFVQTAAVQLLLLHTLEESPTAVRGFSVGLVVAAMRAGGLFAFSVSSQGSADTHLSWTQFTLQRQGGAPDLIRALVPQKFAALATLLVCALLLAISTVLVYWLQPGEAERAEVRSGGGLTVASPSLRAILLGSLPRQASRWLARRHTYRQVATSAESVIELAIQRRGSPASYATLGGFPCTPRSDPGTDASIAGDGGWPAASTEASAVVFLGGGMEPSSPNFEKIALQPLAVAENRLQAPTIARSGAMEDK